MIRRQFIQNMSALSLAGFAGNYPKMAHGKYKDVIVGHNSHRYKIDMNWGLLDSKLYPVNDCHEMVQDSKGKIILLTNHTKNNILVYDKSGQLEEVWGTEFPGAHGLSLHVEQGEDILCITDIERHEVIKTTLKGDIIQTFSCPMDSGKYKDPAQYKPTETAVAKNGDLYIADGYGNQNILHYNAKGELINIFGGRGEGEENLDNAHGICIDNRDKEETLLVTDRMKNKLKRFSMDGQLLSVIHLPGAYICRPVIHKRYLYLATIWSGDGSPGTGFISILDKENKLISAPGGSEPTYSDGVLSPMYQTHQIFQHPHDVCVDEDENLYVAQWNAGNTYPIKLYRV